MMNQQVTYRQEGGEKRRVVGFYQLTKINTFNTVSMKTEHIGKWQIDSFEEKGKILCKVYNNNARKEWKRCKAYYSFKTTQHRDEYIKSFKTRVENQMKWKEEKKQILSNFKNPAKVGDILYSSWGYEQTNIDFYQVISVKGTMIEIRELAQKKQETLWMQGTCMPIKNKFVADAPVLKKRVRPGYYNNQGYVITMNSHSDAYLWDGREKHWTAYA